MEKIKVAILGLAHSHARALYNQFAIYPDEVEIIGFAEAGKTDDQTKEERYKNAEKMRFAVREYEDYHDLLDLKPDIAIVTCENNTSGKISCEALKRGITVVTEKPMCGTYEDALEMVKCAKENGARIFTNWPIAWFPAFRKAKEIADSGRIGEVMRVTYRSPATWGPYSYAPDGQNPPGEELARTWWYRKECGGGSILDYACYGTAIAIWIFGRAPEKVSGLVKSFVTKEFSDVEDFSAMMLDFGDKVGLLEGSWSSFNPGEIPSGPVIYGTEGTIVCDRRSPVVKIYEGRSHVLVEPTEVIAMDGVEDSKLFGRNIIDFMQGKGEINELLTEKLNLAVMASLSAGRKSAETGETVKVEIPEI